MATQSHASSHGPKSRTARHTSLLGNSMKPPAARNIVATLLEGREPSSSSNLAIASRLLPIVGASQTSEAKNHGSPPKTNLAGTHCCGQL